MGCGSLARPFPSRRPQAGGRWVRVGKLGIPKGRLQIDSRGWLHHVHAPEGEGSFVYSISTEGGKTWKRNPVKLPAGHSSEDFDFRANGKLGLTALAISSSIRFDFPTVAVLPNGTIALSFADKAHSSPAIALLLGG